ncbi:hypothetical protein [Anabaena sp. CCY 0017]|uniref:hypothetical protein n=1 Tax=Anabaena sp. CCY 0017 TaxID=3103866 RepID=UPI0039C5B457
MKSAKPASSLLRQMAGLWMEWNAVLLVQQITNHQLRITNYELRITHYELRITNYELRIKA